MSRRDRSSRGCRIMSWCRIMRVNLTPRETSSCGLMEAAWCILVLPQLQAAQSLWAWPRARSRLVPGIPGENTAPLQVLTINLSWLQAQFLFLSLALFLHLPCQRRGDQDIQSGEPAWPVVQTTKKALQFFSPSFYSIRVTHLCTSPLECEIAEVCHAELGRFSMQITGGASLCKRLCCSVVLCPRELAEPLIWLDLDCVIPMKHLWYHFLLKSLHQSEQITIFCFSLRVPGVCDPLHT